MPEDIRTAEDSVIRKIQDRGYVTAKKPPPPRRDDDEAQAADAPPKEPIVGKKKFTFSPAGLGRSVNQLTQREHHREAEDADMAEIFELRGKDTDAAKQKLRKKAYKVSEPPFKTHIETQAEIITAQRVPWDVADPVLDGSPTRNLGGVRVARDPPVVDQGGGAEWLEKTDVVVDGTVPMPSNAERRSLRRRMNDDRVRFPELRPPKVVEEPSSSTEPTPRSRACLTRF